MLSNVKNIEDFTQMLARPAAQQQLLSNNSTSAESHAIDQP